jgi:1-acyl-sn-glycerol-3-phosphate acyltransferase
VAAGRDRDRADRPGIIGAMADRDANDIENDKAGGTEAIDAGLTTEFQAVGEDDRLPALTPDLRHELPGLESERQVTDWGRSERVEGVIDRTLYDFLYHYWFRVEVEGIENVPEHRGALLLANRSGAVPSDVAMIAKAVREEHPWSRPVQLSIDGSLAAIPGLGMMVTKLGGVPDHPANLHRLLFDEAQLVLAFPEGRGAARKPIGRRYRLREFPPDLVQVATRARAPIVPVALLGAEEASPVFARLGRLGPLGAVARLSRLPLAAPLPLPAKFRIRFLEPVEPDPDLDDGSPGCWLELAGEIRGLIQENLLEMVGARRSVWLG